jgi:sec-independent protein translocase protein TatA
LQRACSGVVDAMRGCHRLEQEVTRTGFRKGDNVGGLTPVHLIIVLAIALIVLGPGKLPEVGAALGKSIREFRNAATDVQDAVKVDVSSAPAAPALAAPASLAAVAAPAPAPASADPALNLVAAQAQPAQPRSEAQA